MHLFNQLYLQSNKKHLDMIKWYFDVTLHITCRRLQDICSQVLFKISRGGSRTAATSNMERFVIIVKGWMTLAIITKPSILDVAAALEHFCTEATHSGLDQQTILLKFCFRRG